MCVNECLAGTDICPGLHLEQLEQTVVPIVPINAPNFEQNLKTKPASQIALLCDQIWDLQESWQPRRRAGQLVNTVQYSIMSLTNLQNSPFKLWLSQSMVWDKFVNDNFRVFYKPKQHLTDVYCMTLQT